MLRSMLSQSSPACRISQRVQERLSMTQTEAARPWQLAMVTEHIEL